MQVEQELIKPSILANRYGVCDDPDVMFYFLADDAGFAWVGNDATRGQAIAQTAAHFDVPFTSCRARRVWGHWRHLERVAGWEFEDGTLAPCNKSDYEALPFWEVVVQPARSL